MRKLSILLSILFLTACAGEFDARVYPTATIADTAVPTWTATSTLEPTPTIGYQATAEIAQQTAEAAIRLNVAVTAEAEQRIQQQMAWTAEANVREQELLGWTATAASTSVALTATQQAVLNTQIPAQQALMSAQMTATQGAPTLMVAMRGAEIEVYWAPLEYFLKAMMMVAVSALFVTGSLALYADYQRKKRSENAAACSGAENDAPVIVPTDLPMHTVVDLKTDNGGGFSSTQRLVVPCNAKQLTHLAAGLISGRKTLAYKYWEVKGSLGRETYDKVRDFMLAKENGFAVDNGKGVLALTDKGRDFFRNWLDQNVLPHSYEFEPESQGLQGESAHDHENHAHDFPVGEFLRVTAQAEEDSVRRLAARRLI